MNWKKIGTSYEPIQEFRGVKGGRLEIRFDENGAPIKFKQTTTNKYNNTNNFFFLFRFLTSKKTSISKRKSDLLSCFYGKFFSYMSIEPLRVYYSLKYI